MDNVSPDPIFAQQRLADIYDALDPDRGDLDAYAAIVAELRAGSVLDLGCGTGELAVRLAAAGIDVTGVDPAAASLAVARAKPHAQAVRWLLGDATALPAMQVDLAVMVGNVAQVFLGDDDWASMLRGVRAALRPGGHLVFEVRDPDQRAWEGWTPDRTRTRADIPGVGVVETWCAVTDVSGDRVSFRWTFRFERDGAELISDSTLRFRSRTQIADSLAANGFDVIDVRDAPDRPGLEFVFLARSMTDAVPTVTADTERIRVTTWRFAQPGAATGRHLHEFDYVVVPVTGGTFAVVLPDGTQRQMTQVPGAPYLGSAGTEHDVISAGEGERAFVEIEYKS